MNEPTSLFAVYSQHKAAYSNTLVPTKRIASYKELSWRSFAASDRAALLSQVLGHDPPRVTPAPFAVAPRPRTLVAVAGLRGHPVAQAAARRVSRKELK